MRDSDGGSDKTERVEVDHDGPLELESLGQPGHARVRHRVVWAVVAACSVLLFAAALLIPSLRSTGGEGAGLGGTSASPPATELTVPAAPETTAGPKAIVSIRSVDLANATYPSTACPVEYRLPGATFTLVNGVAGSLPDQMGEPRTDLMRGVDLQGVTYGDVTGDGIEEAVVLLRCYHPNSDAISKGVAVMGLSGDQLVALAVLPDSMVAAVGTKVVVDDDRTPVRLEPTALEYDLAEEARVVSGQLVVRWQQTSLGGDALGAGYDVTAIYRIGPQGASVVGEPTRSVIPTGIEPTRLAAYAIRTADLRSLTLPLAADGRDPGDRVCPAVFDPVGPVRDATLHDGAAVVVAADGRELDASVRIEDVRYGLADPDPYEDAFVLVRCTAGDETGQTTVVVPWVEGGPLVAHVLG